MSDNEFSVRLDGIETQWSLIRRAHDVDQTDVAQARQSLVMRYSSAIRRYTAAITRDADDADEIAQDIIVRMLQGDFGGADPERGRFRDLLKVAVRNMIRNFWRKENRRKTVDYDVDLEEGAAEDVDSRWDDSWKKNLMELAWGRLEAFENKTNGSFAHAALRLRVRQPDATSEAMAETLSNQLGREIKAPALRQQLRRARVRFAEYLVQELADGLDEPTPRRIQDELIALGLYARIKDVLPEQWR